MTRISLVFGTRPEAIKLAPVILAFQADSRFEPHVCVTGQHREMLDQVLQVFEIKPDVDLNLMQPNQTLGGITSSIIASVDRYLKRVRPDMVLVQGDTTTVLCTALAAFYQRIPVGHVEAGLRTWNRHSPFPEEMNRVLTSRLSDIHFAPTERSKNNLITERVPDSNVFVTGNTVIDALMIASEKALLNPPIVEGLPETLFSDSARQPLVLITGHRRENFGPGLRNICGAIAALANRRPETNFVYPVHLNPNVREVVHELLGDFANVRLIPPLTYIEFVALMNRADIILTDSGGVQEEAPSLGKPVLVMRDTTERPEGIAAGTAKLVGADKEAIIEHVELLLSDREAYAEMAGAVNPYGDGQASGRILEACGKFLEN